MTLPLNDTNEAATEGPARPNGFDTMSEESPFVPYVPRSRGLARLTFVSAVALALLGAYLATRSRKDTEATPTHEHSATPARNARPVMLSSEQARRIGVTYTTVTMGRLPMEVRTVAQVTYDETRMKTIAPKLDGWVDQLYVNITGQTVRQGDPLLAIYSPMLVSAQQEFLLADQLAKDMAGAAPEAQRQSVGLRDAARGRLLYWDVPADEVRRIEQTGEVQKSMILRSPVSGVIVEKSVLSGQKIMAGDALFKVADLDVVWLEGEVFERDLASVRAGQRVRAEFQALPGESRTGRIAYLYPTVNPDTRTSRIRVELANRDLVLKPGMYATIFIHGATSSSSLKVARSAVLTTGERNLVFVRRSDGMLEPRDVTVGAATDDEVQLLGGVRAGETVVKSATFLIDAESNLGTALGGMGNMPGMDVTAPRSAPQPKRE